VNAYVSTLAKPTISIDNTACATSVILLSTPRDAQAQRLGLNCLHSCVLASRPILNGPLSSRRALQPLLTGTCSLHKMHAVTNLASTLVYAQAAELKNCSSRCCGLSGVTLTLTRCNSHGFSQHPVGARRLGAGRMGPAFADEEVPLATLPMAVALTRVSQPPSLQKRSFSHCQRVPSSRSPRHRAREPAHRCAGAAYGCPALMPLRTVSTWCNISSRGPGGMPASRRALHMAAALSMPPCIALQTILAITA